MPEQQLEKFFIENISLVNYRNFQELSLNFSQDINIIHGRNGLGKTNILEAISLFAPGNGLRKAKLDEFKNKFANDNSLSGWFVKVYLASSKGQNNKIVTSKEDSNRRRSIILDSGNNLSQSEIVKYLNIIWLTPQIDNLLNEDKERRRKFIDRIIFNFHYEHLKNLNKHGKLLKERIKILENGNDNIWLDNIELQISEIACQIAYARVEIIGYLNEIIAECDKSFPKGKIIIKSEIEEMITADLKPNQLEAFIRSRYADKRYIDRIRKTTSFGIQKFDFDCYLSEKNLSAKYCSTGEQKSMLVMINLAYAILNQKLLNKKPILLLDEFISHIDKNNLSALIKELIANSSQTFITTTDKSSFQANENQAFHYIDLESN